MPFFRITASDLRHLALPHTYVPRIPSPELPMYLSDAGNYVCGSQTVIEAETFHEARSFYLKVFPGSTIEDIAPLAKAPRCVYAGRDWVRG